MRSIQGSSFLRFLVLVALAVCLSSGLAKAQTLRGESSSAGATGGTATTLSTPWYSSMLNASATPKYTPPDPCRPPEPPDPCTFGQWVERLLAAVVSLL
jgi:hypothetical protein